MFCYAYFSRLFNIGRPEICLGYSSVLVDMVYAPDKHFVCLYEGKQGLPFTINCEFGKSIEEFSYAHSIFYTYWRGVVVQYYSTLLLSENNLNYKCVFYIIYSGKKYLWVS